MKKFFASLLIFLLSSTVLFAEYRLEPVNCTLKKKSNCGAYLYNSNTGATYFCDSEKCKEVMAAMEEGSVVKDGKKNLKYLKTKIKKSKIPKI